jgi:hypothetical protein
MADRKKLGGWAAKVKKLPRAFDRSAAMSKMHSAELEPKHYRQAYKKFLAGRNMVALPSPCKGKTLVALKATAVTVSSHPPGSDAATEILGHWTSNGAGKQWITFDFGKKVTISQVHTFAARIT